MNILIVEDSPLELKRIERLVSEIEPCAHVDSFSDSAEAAQLIREHRVLPDAAFLDIEMPPPNGAELAQLLIAEFPRVNIIFTTAYQSYMKQAFDMFASGYLLKPFSTAEVREQLAHLRYPVPKTALFARTKGKFDLFYQGKPVAFTLARSKEALAYLIDRQGASVTKRELFSILFEDAEYNAGKQDHMKKIMQALRASLSQVGGADILLHSRNSYAVDMTKLSTDMDSARKPGESPYMEQYSWADGWLL